MPPKLTTEDDGTPIQTMTVDSLSELIKKGTKTVGAAPAPAESKAQQANQQEPAPKPDGKVEPDTNATTTTATAQAAQSESTPIPVRTFGPPDTQITTEMILGHSLTPAPATPVAMPPTDVVAVTGGPKKHPTDPLEQARRSDRSEETRRKSDAAIGRLLADYPSTRMVNIKLAWRDPVTRSYRKKGRVKNVSINDVRDPESWCEGPDGVMYGGEWVMGYQPADQGKHFDDPKSWYEFDFDRDGPEPPREWTIDQPRYEKVVVEVEGMGQIALPELTKLIEGTVASALKQAQAQGQGPGQTPPQAPPMPPTMGYGPPVMPGYGVGMGGMGPLPHSMRDTKADEREKRLEEQLNKQQEKIDLLLRQQAERDKQAAEEKARAEREAAEARARAERVEAEARHTAELNALKLSFQSTIDQTTRALEAVTAKLNAIEQRVNSPVTRDDASAMNAIKEILIGNRNAEAEAIRAREAAQAEERRREMEERRARLEEERLAREREREEARERREREREEERARREEERARREAADREAQRTLEQYRMLGESALQSARAVAEITGKQNDPSPTLTVMNAMAQQQIQQAQLLATLFKNFGQVGGSGGGTNWAEMIAQLAPDAFRAISDIGAAIAEASAAKAKAAAQATQAAVNSLPPTAPAFAGVPPQAAYAPRYAPRQPQVLPQPPQAMPTKPTQQVAAPPQAAQTQPTTGPQTPQPQPNPLSALIAGVNQAIAAKEAPEKVAGKLASIVHVAQEFGTTGTGRPVSSAIRALMEDPLKFLKRAYPSSDPSYLEQIAKILLEQYGPEEDETEDEGKNNNNMKPQEIAEANQEDEQEANAQITAAETEHESKTEYEPETEPESPSPREVTEQEMLAAMLKQNERPAVPTTSPTEAEMLAAMRAQAQAQALADDGNGNGNKPKHRGRGGTRRSARQVELIKAQNQQDGKTPDGTVV